MTQYLFKPAIVVVAYERPNCLERLLKALLKARYEASSTPLIICLDGDSHPKVVHIAKTFDWQFGEKRIIEQEAHLGLKRHILQCGKLTSEYGSIILLEDDLVISPSFYEYAIQVTPYYAADDRIAGISLYSYALTENGFYPFQPLTDQSDVYFMQVASSWGQVWTQKQWQGFEQWFEENEEIADKEIVPSYLLKWSEYSWKKHFIRYLVQTNKYFVFPRNSLSTNPGEPGTNTDRKGIFQVPLFYGFKLFKCIPFGDSHVKYDAWFEPEPDTLNYLTPVLNKYAFGVDLMATKSKNEIGEEYVLTTRELSHSILQFGFDQVPFASNVIENVKGDIISFGHTSGMGKPKLRRHRFFNTLDAILEEVFAQEFDSRIQSLEDEINNYQLKLDEYNEKLDVYRREYVRKKEFEEAWRFKEQFPLISIVLEQETDNHKELHQRLENLKSIGYPRLEVILISTDDLDISDYSVDLCIEKVKINRALSEATNYMKAFHECSGDYIGILGEHSRYYRHTLTNVADLFRQFSHINWICGIPMQSNPESGSKQLSKLADNRLTMKNYHSLGAGKAVNIMNSGNIFFRPSLAQKHTGFVKSHEKLLNIYNIWEEFFRVERLYAYDGLLSFSIADRISLLDKMAKWDLFKSRLAEIQYESLIRRTAKKLSHPFFRKNLPVLRTFYLEMEQLSDVIKYDYQSANYYLSKY